MTPQEFWNDYVGGESPGDFMCRFHSRNVERNVTRHIAAQGVIFGVVRRQGWKDTFAAPAQHARAEVVSALMAHLGETRDDWIAALRDQSERERAEREAADRDRSDATSEAAAAAAAAAAVASVTTVSATPSPTANESAAPAETDTEPAPAVTDGEPAPVETDAETASAGCPGESQPTTP